MIQMTKYIIMAGLLSFMHGCSGQGGDSATLELKQKISIDESDTLKPIITFVELGSVNCIPCKKMQPVMKAIEEKYGNQIDIVFYDVWKPEESKYAQVYGIRLIPTQVFLNKDGKELFRHEGFFPEESIDKFLKEQGLSPK